MLGNVYEKIVDEESRKIFKARLLYSLTGDFIEVRKLIETTGAAKEIRRRIKQAEDKDFVIWGTGFWGKEIIMAFPEVNWKCYVDSQPKEAVLNGLPVYPADVFLHEYQGEQVVIATAFYEKEIYRQLSDSLEESSIINAGKLINELTVCNFLKWSGNKYKEIISFEPDACCYKKCGEKLKNVKNLSLVNKGAWSKEDKLRFEATGVSDSKISEYGNTEIVTCRLDDVLQDKQVTFLKMDIEGAEKEALIGAERIIRIHKPKLAISVYHKKEDIWEIPKLLLEMNPHYRFYLWHYSLRYAETVLYAL